MRKTIALTALICVGASGVAMASAYRIPEQNIDSTAKAGANIASADRAATAYDNPANMSWVDNGWLTEIGLTYIHLTPIDYNDARTSAFDGSSKKEEFLLPTVFVVSPSYNNFRFGFSITGPYGLAKRWSDPYPATYAKKFELKVFDFNPTVSYKINDMISLAAGARLLLAKGTVRNQGMTPAGVSFSRDLTGNYETDWGYNLALSVKPIEPLNLSVTYRSNVDMGLTGDATLTTNFPSPTVFTSGGNVDLPAPAVLAVSAAYSWEKLTMEFTWDRTFWSKYENLDIRYNQPLTNPVLFSLFGSPVPRNWDDTNAFRISASYEFNNTFTGMAGFAIDNNPIPDETVDFSLPDSDALLFSLGGRYKVNDKTEVGLGVLYDHKDSRSVSNDIAVGEFKNAQAWLVTLGFSYKF
jgi:long-chain fatty acid transport protein